jgi:hypothetical protein
MAWVCAYENIEYISNKQPIRSEVSNHFVIQNGVFFELPKGSIEKLIGRPLTWSDEPVEIKEVLNIIANDTVCNINGTGSYCNRCGDVSKCNKPVELKEN